MSQSIVENSNLEAHSISVKSSSQLAELHGEQFPHFTETSFPRLFEHQVSIRPNATAIVCENQQLTFRELNARANQLAGHLQTLGISRESIVGICIDRSVEMAVAIIATLKAGAAYLPLDPEYPTERLAFMLEDARPTIVLTKASLVENSFSPLPLGEGAGVRVYDALSPHPIPPPKGDGAPLLIQLDKEWPTIAQSSEADLDCAPAKDDLAYVIYTSGSTGNPKGVMITHGNLTNYLLALNHELKINADDLYLHTASIAFSSSRRQLLLPLSQGAGVVVATSEQRKDPLALFQMIKARAVSVMDAVPSFWRNCTTIIGGLPENERHELLDNQLRLMLSASEPLLSEIPRKWMTDFNHPAHHVHMFGQTETAGIVALFHVSRNFASETHVPVGNPIANTDIYVLNENQQPCAIEEAGELYIGGAGVGRGYLNRSQLTAEKFIERDGQRLYRTGDWARVAANGQIEFAGRRDQQVKLRGFRIELGEIEAALSQHPSVRECVVVVRESSNGTGDKKLVAYFVPHNDGVSVSDLRAFLSARVPDYAVPSAFLELKSLPISANGKVDRLRLPEPEISRAGVSAHFVAPQNPIEIRLAQIWSEVLSVDVIGRDDNFFELGGHSLLAAQIAARVRNEFNVETPLHTFFACPTVALLAAQMQEGTKGRLATEPILQLPKLCVHERGNEAPLSFAQQRLWFMNQLEPDSSSYNIRRAMQINGALDVDKLRQALEAIVARHEILRTSFVSHDGHPVQVINPSLGTPLEFMDLRGLPVAEREAEVERVAAAEGQKPFDLAGDPLLRVRLLRLSDDEHRLLLTIHHIISDGWSVGVFMGELTALYDAFNADQNPDLPLLQIQYADFALWQLSWLKDEVLEQQLTYWKQQLKDVPASLELRTDYPRPPVQSFRGAQQSVLLPADLCEAIKTLGQREGVTLFMTLLAAFQTLLYRYSGQDDIVVGSPIAGRTLIETEALIGFFVNTLVLRSDLSGNPSFRELLGRIRETALGAYTHQDVPFEKLVAELHPERSLDRTPLFQVMFALQNAPMPPQSQVNGLMLTPVELESTTAKFDLTLDVVEEGRVLRVSLKYNTDLFAAATIGRMLGHFQALLNAVAEDARQRIAELVLLTEKERRQLLVEWNDTETEYPRAACVHHLFEGQVEKTPAAIAVTFEDEQITYYELNRRANQLAQFLIKQGVGPEVLVGICVERSLEMVIGLLGILKAGGAYVPLDPAFPKERLAFMIEDANVPVLLTQQKLSADLPTHQARLVCLDSDWETIANESAADPSSVATNDNLAYVIYTSGSTGKPKGAMITHGAICNRLLWMQDAYQIDASDRVLQKTPFSFDVSVWEFFWPLITGATLVVARPGGHQDSAYLAQVISEQQITTMHFVPSMLAVFLEEQGLRSSCSSLRRVICSGEALPYELQERFFARLDTDLHNLYGPTEAAVDVTFWQCERGSARQIVPIGRPISNIQMYVLGADMQPVPVSVGGELHIGGIGLARGYLNRTELTAEKFVSNPFSSGAQARLYKTGDLARYLPDGNIEYLGRLDDQVKIRGFRIELGEIESTLRQHAKVRESVVVAREDTPGNKILVGYVVSVTDAKVDSRELRAFLQDKLPEYMVPAMLVELPELPLTSSGKVNRRALPAPDYCAQLDESYVAPRTIVEELLAGIWAEVLKVPRVGVNDNFFELGGHSLLATQVVSRALKTLGAQLPLRALFEAPTVAGMAERIEASREDATLTTLPITALPRDNAAPLSFGQQSFWVLDSLTPNTSAYNIFRVVRLRGKLNVPALQNALDRVMARHESTRTVFPCVNGEPAQVILENQKLPLSEIDLSSLSAAARERQLRRLLNDEAQRPFDLARGPLVRAALFVLDMEEHVLLLSMHHIIADDWSMGILSSDLKGLYDSFVMGRPPELPELPIQYADYAHWQRAGLQDGILARQLQYWKQQLAGAPRLLELPTDRPRPSALTLRGARHTVTLPLDLHNQLVKLSRREGVSLFMTMLAAFQTLLGHLSGQDDIVVGSPIAGRNRVETENLIGQFVNTLVLRTSLFGNPTFTELLSRVRDVALGAFAHQETPFEKLVAELQPQRSLSHMPLFQAMFVFQNAPAFDLQLSGLSISREKLYNESSPLDLTLEARETADGVRCVFEYKTDLFDATTIERLAERFQLLLKGIIADPEQRLSDLSMLSESERHQLLVEWNDNRVDFPQHACIHHLFETQAAKTPEAVAARFRDEQMSYGELNARANQLARYLINQGVGPEILVGISIERSLDMLVAIFGVLKAGGGYVPLDPNYPRDRIAFMIHDAALPLVITQKHLAKDIPAKAQLLCIDSDWERIAREAADNPSVKAGAANVAYVIYTSGSTGNPKGVAVEHRSLANFTLAATAAYEIKPHDRVLQFASLSFDLSAEEIYPALTHGATVVLRTDDMISSARDFLRHCDEQRISIIDLPTAYWHELAGALAIQDLQLPENLRLVIIGGEKASPDRVDAWHKQVGNKVRLVNTYGPTETTVAVTICDLKPDERIASGIIPIGRPMVNTSVYVLDPARKPVSIGVAGELYIGGPGVARGYINRPDLTAEKFIRNPFVDDPAGRLYKTGDVVRYRADGNLEFLGRVDNQIKIRGFRVELEEIEQALRSHDGVRDCVVVLREDHDKRLIAYVVAKAASALAVGELRNFLKAKLPVYMVPAAFELIDALPLMPNGKIDRRALSESQAPAVVNNTFVAPVTPIEELLASAWREVLRVSRVGVHDNFFDLGGHSLLAAKIVSNVRDVLDVQFAMVDVFQAPTVRSLAELLYPRVAERESQSDLAMLLEEIGAMSEAEAQRYLASELPPPAVAIT
jgi:amino acid adenylation domain-containing protein